MEQQSIAGGGGEIATEEEGGTTSSQEEAIPIQVARLKAEKRSRTASFEKFARRMSLPVKHDEDLDETVAMLRTLVETMENEITERDQRITQVMQESEFLRGVNEVKSQKIELLKREVERRANEKMENENDTHKQIYVLVSKLQRLEEEKIKYELELREQKDENANQLNQITELRAMLEDEEKKENRIEQLTNILQSTRKELRMVQSQNSIMDEKVKTLERDLQEAHAKYGLLDKQKISKVLNNQKEMVLENAELRERMRLKDMHVNELKEMKDNLENLLVETKHKTERILEKHSLDNEKLRRMLATEEGRRQRAEDTLVELKSKLENTEHDLIKIKEELKHSTEKYNSLRVDSGLMAAEMEELRKEQAMYHEQLETARVAHDQTKEQLRITQERLSAIQKELGEARQEMLFKDSVMRRVKEEAKEDTSNRKAALNFQTKDQKVNWMKNRIALLEKELDETKEALTAHQNHSAFLAQEINRVQRDHLIQLKVKNQTIARLRTEIDRKSQRVSLDSPVRERREDEEKESQTSTKTADPETRDMIDDLKSQLDLLRRQWPGWVEMKVNEYIRKNSGGNNLSRNASFSTELLELQQKYNRKGGPNHSMSSPTLTTSQNPKSGGGGPTFNKELSLRQSQPITPQGPTKTSATTSNASLVSPAPLSHSAERTEKPEQSGDPSLQQTLANMVNEEMINDIINSIPVDTSPPTTYDSTSGSSASALSSSKTKKKKRKAKVIDIV